MDKNKWLEGKDAYKLCYVDGNFAYFTNIPLSEQWGDDWDDEPYEHNAGEPYYKTKDQIIKIAFDGFDIMTPSDRNSSYSVAQINSGAIAWITGNNYIEKEGNYKVEHISILAGVNISDFIAKIELLGGNIYLPF